STHQTYQDPILLANLRFSAATLLTIATGIVAMPWSSKSTSNEEITLRIKVSQSPAKLKGVLPSKLDICWLLCAQESIECPENWRDVGKQDRMQGTLKPEQNQTPGDISDGRHESHPLLQILKRLRLLSAELKGDATKVTKAVFLAWPVYHRTTSTVSASPCCIIYKGLFDNAETNVEDDISLLYLNEIIPIYSFSRCEKFEKKSLELLARAEKKSSGPDGEDKANIMQWGWLA
ncbi:hypothetical protein B0J13DRAFT_637095, partial [Dactylonectria estremocensis]